jgi:hypothetical protein
MSIQEDCHGLGFGCSTKPGFEHCLTLSIDAEQAPLAPVWMLWEALWVCITPRAHCPG